jgi:hypothetical protein
MALAILVAIGCGSGKPQEAAAVDEAAEAQQPAAPAAPATPPAASPEAPAGGGGTITGSVRFMGAPPQAQAVKMDADPVCKQQHATPVMSEEVVVNQNGTLKNVFVYVKEGAQPAAAPPAAPVVLDQAGCWYKPHVFGIQVNQPLEIVNSDATLHNVNAKPAANQAFNVAQPAKGMRTTKKFAKPEVGVKFKCNVHPWMSAYAVVLDHPYFAVTDDQGAFSITGLPAGSYTLEAWHEKYGAQTQTVVVGSGETKSVELTVKAP